LKTLLEIKEKNLVPQEGGWTKLPMTLRIKVKDKGEADRDKAKYEKEFKDKGLQFDTTIIEEPDVIVPAPTNTRIPNP